MTLIRYVTAVVALAGALAALAWAAWRLRRALLPGHTGAAGRLAEVVLGLSLLVVVLQAAGAVGGYRTLVVVVAVPAVALAAGAAAPALGRRLGPGDPPAAGGGEPEPAPPGPGRPWVWLGLAVTLVVVAQWAAHTHTGLGRGVSDLDSLRYHGPFAARWVQQHSIAHLQHTSAQNQETYFPGNTELLDGYGILVFGRDLLTPLRNLPWLALALGAAWCAGRRLGHGPAALAAVAAVCSTPLLSSIEPGSAKNDIAALALVLATAALLVHARPAVGTRGLAPMAVAGLAAGLAVGTKLTALGPVLALAAGACLLAGRGRRLWTAAALVAPALVTGGFWYARNLVYTGTPLPWFRIHLGPVTLAGPDMPYDDRFAHSVAHYAGSSSFWTNTGLPGLLHSFGPLWPVLLGGAVAAAGLAAAGRPGHARLVGAAALASLVAYLFTPWGAGGPEGTPRYFALDLRFMAPALGLAALGLAALAATRPRAGRAALVATAVVVAADVARSPATPPAMAVAVAAGGVLGAIGAAGWWLVTRLDPARSRRLAPLGAATTVVVALGVAGWPVQRDYLEDRYAADELGHGIELPMFRNISHQRIAVGGFADDYQLFGLTLTNQVQYIGVEGPHGAYRPAATCREWLSGLARGHYDYVVVSVSPAVHHPGQPKEEDWTKRDRAARTVLANDVTTVFRLVGRPDPASCARPHRG